MQNLIVYGSAFGFLFCLFPVYLTVYVYANTETKYASVNLCIYRYIRFLNINTADNGEKMQINGKDAQIQPYTLVKNTKILVDHICIFKIIQLGDYGIRGGLNAYTALLQNAITLPVYKYLECSGSEYKLKNYTILNAEHCYLHYAAKSACVINMLAALKVLFIIFLEKVK